MPLNNVEGLNSAIQGKKTEPSGINYSYIKASIFDNYTGDINAGKNSFFNLAKKESSDTLQINSNIHQVKAEFNTAFENTLADEPKGFFSLLKDFIMGFGDIKPEEFCY